MTAGAGPVVVLGSGLAGWSTVRELRKLDPTVPVIVITADEGDFYAKPSLSNAFAQRKLPAQQVSTPAATMAASLNVTLMQRTTVRAIDREAREVVTDRGRIGYGAVVLALGAEPIRVALAGDGAADVRSVNSLDDFSAFHGNGAHLRLGLANGEAFEADVVLSAIGLRPQTALAKAADLVVGRGVVVDSGLATSDESIFALGDCAEYAGGRCLPYVLPIMSAARVLATRLSGVAAQLVFPAMPVSVKTPALPLVVATPAADRAGRWHAPQEGQWDFLDDKGQAHGFVLAGGQTARRAELARRIAAV